MHRKKPAVKDMKFMWADEAKGHSIHPHLIDLHDVSKQSFAAIHDSQVVGTVRFSNKNGSEQVSNLFMHPDFRGNGVSESFLEQAISARFERSPELEHIYFTVDHIDPQKVMRWHMEKNGKRSIEERREAQQKALVVWYEKFRGVETIDHPEYSHRVSRRPFKSDK
jgi:hypothetical protein